MEKALQPGDRRATGAGDPSSEARAVAWLGKGSAPLPRSPLFWSLELPAGWGGRWTGLGGPEVLTAEVPGAAPSSPSLWEPSICRAGREPGCGNMGEVGARGGQMAGNSAERLAAMQKAPGWRAQLKRMLWTRSPDSVRAGQTRECGDPASPPTVFPPLDRGCWLTAAPKLRVENGSLGNGMSLLAFVQGG